MEGKVITTKVLIDNFSTYHIEENEQKIVLVIGVTGSGKSSIIQHFVYQDYSKMDLSLFKQLATSVTKNIKRYKTPTYVLKEGRYNFHMYDTIGIGSDDIDVKTVFDQLALQTEYTEEIQTIMIVMKMERSRPKAIRDLCKMLHGLSNLGAQKEHILFLLSYTDPWSKDIIQEYIDDMIPRLNTELMHEFKSGLFNFDSSDIMPVCFANCTDVNDVLKKSYLELVTQSKGNVMSKLISSKGYFEPRKHTIIKMQVEKQKQDKTIFILAVIASLFVLFAIIKIAIELFWPYKIATY